MPDDFAVIRRALDELPAACRYHGDRLDGDGPWRDVCCDTGRPSKLRRDALAALGRARQRAEGEQQTIARLRQRAEDAEARLSLAKHALVADGYFTPDEISAGQQQPDIAPRITERLTKAREAEDAVRRVMVVHRPGALHEATGRRPYCVNCRFQWPCPTARAVNEEITEEIPE